MNTSMGIYESPTIYGLRVLDANNVLIEGLCFEGIDWQSRVAAANLPSVLKKEHVVQTKHCAYATYANPMQPTYFWRAYRFDLEKVI